MPNRHVTLFFSTHLLATVFARALFVFYAVFLVFAGMTTHTAQAKNHTPNLPANPTASSTLNLAANKKVTTYKPLPTQIQQALQAAAISPDEISIIVQQVMPAQKNRQQRQHTQKQDTQKHSKLKSNLARIAHLPHTPRLPASTLKLFTTFTALDTLGKHFQWQTKVYHTGYIKNGVLYGDLIIQGGADPKLVKEHIISLFTKVQAQGIKRIAGNMLLDTTLFSLAPHDPAAFDDKPLRPYNAGASGLLVNFSSLILHFTPEPSSGKAVVSFEPIITDTHLPKTVPLAKKAACKNWRIQLAASFTQNVLNFSGDYQEGCGFGTWAIAHPNPNHFAKGVLKGNWLALGGELLGKVRFAKKPASAKFLTKQASPTLSSIIKDINQFSNNVMTEQVFLSLPAFAKQHRQPAPMTYAKARTWYAHWWQRHFARINKGKLPPPKLTKASGLCHDCMISPLTLHALLHYAAHHAEFETFLASLSVAGESGTIKGYRYRIPESYAIGRAYLKTGTLDNVTSVAGYVDAKSGKRFSVVAIINTPNAKHGKAVLDQIIDWTANQ